MKIFKKNIRLKLATVIAASLILATGSVVSAQPSELAKRLPASDAVFTLDSKKLVSESIPEVLVNRPELLSKVGQGIAKLRKNTGIDLYKFDQVAGGFKSVGQENGDVVFEPLILAQGTFSEKDIVSGIKLASNGDYKQVQYKGKTIYLLSPRELMEAAAKKKGAPAKADSFIVKTGKRLFGTIYEEIAITVLTNDTVAFGTKERVVESIDGNSQIDSQVLGLLDVRDGAILQFGVNLPKGVSSLITLGQDGLGEALDSIRIIKGAATIEGPEGLIDIVAVTDDNDSARKLETTLSSLQKVGGLLIGNNGSAKKQVYARMVENLSIKREANQVMLSLGVPQTDIDILLAGK